MDYRGAARYSVNFMRECRSLWHINNLLLKQSDNYHVIKTTLTHKFCRLSDYASGSIISNRRKFLQKRQVYILDTLYPLCTEFYSLKWLSYHFCDECFCNKVAHIVHTMWVNFEATTGDTSLCLYLFVIVVSALFQLQVRPLVWLLYLNK